MTDQPERIRLNEAINRVGAAIYGADWIGQLTERERWLLERYVEPKAMKMAMKMMLPRRPGNDLLRDRHWDEDDPPPALQAEVEKAKDRREWQLSQRERVSNWLIQHGMDVRIRREKGSLIIPRFVEKQLFERTFAADFPTLRSRALVNSARKRKKTKEQEAKEFIAAAFPDGIPGGVSYKEIARRIQTEKGVQMDADTVARAHKNAG